jgi:DNA-binding GntR family transcriptional regulator
MTQVSPQQVRPRAAKLASLSDQVYEHLRSAIIRAELQPGEKLVELNIAAQMGTSQGPVREALQRLERDGLVEHRARSATFVTAIRNDEIYELFSIRSVIEGFAIQRAAQKITHAQCAELDELIQKMAQAGGLKEMFLLAEYDMQFHRRIVEWSGSAGLLHVWSPLSNQIQRFVVQSHPLHYPDLVEVGTRHQCIVTALRQHDGTGSVKAVQEHIMLIWSRIKP